MKIREKIDIAVKAHLLGGMIKDEDGIFALSTDIADAIQKELISKMPKKNDESTFPELEEDSPELNKMLGWNACLSEVLEAIKELCE